MSAKMTILHLQFIGCRAPQRTSRGQLVRRISGITTQVNDAFSLIWNHTFSPTLLNQARANAAGYRWNEVSSNPQEPFGLPQDNIGNVNDSSCGGSACSFGTANLQYFGAPGPTDLNQWTYDYNDVLTKVMGRHSIKAGGDLTRLYYLNNAVYAARPSFTFRNLWDFANDAPYSETGQFNSIHRRSLGESRGQPVQRVGLLCAGRLQSSPQPDRQPGPALVLLRRVLFEAEQPGRVALRIGGDSLSGLNVRVGGPLYNPQKYNFGPQVGFAWQPSESTNRMVVRGGFRDQL